MKKIFALIVCFMCTLCGCQAQNQTASANKLKVVTTIFPIYDFVRAVAGDKADITLLIDPATEVHTFDPSPSDMIKIHNCDAFFYIGGESDKWVDSISENISKPTALIHAVESSNIQELSHNHMDEHIWTSPDNACKMVAKIAEVLSNVDPENREFFDEKAKSYTKEIEAVTQLIRNIVSTQDNPFVVVADRNPYVHLFEQFSIEYKAALDGCATSSDISLNTMNELISTVEEKNIKSAFYTEMSNKKIADALSAQTGVELYQLHSVHNVTADEFKSGVTYVELMRANAEALKKGWTK